MKIQFSMSSQLWIQVPDMTKYLISSAKAPKQNNLTYIDLYDTFIAKKEKEEEKEKEKEKGK